MLEQAFEVATEFRFDVGQALLSTQGLQDAVGQLSKTADSAMASLGYLASGLVARLGFGSGGLLSVLSKAVQTSEAFNEASLGFANNISSNMQVLSGTINTFNERLGTSQMLMESISDQAIKVGLDTDQLANITKLIATPLAARGKLGTNYQGAISMASNLMLGSAAVGMHPEVASESLYRALTEHMPLHGQLFARLVNTPAFKENHTVTQSQLLMMNQDKKIDLLTRALGELAGDAEFAANRINSIRVQFTLLKDQIEVVLKPIGDAIVKPLRMIMANVNTYLKSHGKELGESIAKLIGNIIGDPQALFVNLYQLSRLKSDFKRAVDWATVITTLTFVVGMLKKIGITFNGGIIKAGAEGIMNFFIKTLPEIGYWLGRAVRFIRPAVGEFISVFAPLLFFFQILSRARGIAKLNDIGNLATLAPKFAAVMVRLKTAFEQIMLPINMAINAWAKILAPLFETSTWATIALYALDGLATVMEFLGKVVIYTMGAVAALTNVLVGFVYDIVHLQNPFGHTVERLKTGFKDWMSDHPLGDDKKAVVNQVTNIGKLEANFNMKEQLEPDRVAFAVTQKLKQLAMNPQQGRGHSIHSGFGGATTIAGGR